jgi:phosphoribosylformylglycinamidine cyclo-ligase
LLSITLSPHVAQPLDGKQKGLKPVSDPLPPSYDYATAGVDIAAGNALVSAIKPAAASTRRIGADAGLGGFGALFDLKAAGYHDPILVSGTDGAGTKLRIALDTGLHQNVGIDLVAMCANDILVQGAEPLFFLDYFATGKLDPKIATEVIEGIARGCVEAGCALIGGETAEMPGMYAHGDYDLAGFVVGAVERDQIITGATIKPGDAIIGLASSGVHSNGFSLVRKLVADFDLAYDQPAPFDGQKSLGEALLTPTRLYIKSCLPLLRSGEIKGMAHITGGGLLENVPRCLPKDLCATIDVDRWPLPPVFRWLQEAGHITPYELGRTFNCGLGMVLFVDPDRAEQIMAALDGAGESAMHIGMVEEKPGKARCRLRGKAGAWGARQGFDHITDEG